MGWGRMLLLGNLGQQLDIEEQRREIQDLRSRVLELTGSKSDIVYESLPVDDPKVRQPDIARAKEILEWQPEVPVEEGLRTTIEYFKSVM